MKIVLRGFWTILRGIFRYSGLEHIYRKLIPPKEQLPLPTFFVWVIGIYAAFFGVVSAKYESRLDALENRANVVSMLLNSDPQTASRQVAILQSTRLPYKPVFLNPISTFKSLWIDERSEDVVETLKAAVEGVKKRLKGVDLKQTDLSGIDFREANLGGANLRQTNLSKANLFMADLSGAKLTQANLQGADLTSARLSDARLEAANLQGARLVGAERFRTTLSDANLSKAQLPVRTIMNLDIDFPPRHWKRDRGDLPIAITILKEADLRRADLSEANLEGVDMRLANMGSATLEGAWLAGTDLRETKFHTLEQVSKARTLYAAHLDHELEAEVRAKYPRLFDKPREE